MNTGLINISNMQFSIAFFELNNTRRAVVNISVLIDSCIQRNKTHSKLTNAILRSLDDFVIGWVFLYVAATGK